MKKLINILGVSALLLTQTGCQDWLDMPSKNKFDSSTIFENVSRAEMVLLSCYTQTFNRELYYQLGMGTDECISTEGETNSKNQVANYLYTTSNIPTSTYTTMYSGIEYANICIKNLPKMSAVSEAEQRKINMLLGEAYAVRAMNYLNIVRFFGDVPFATIPVEDQTTFASSRVSRDRILDNCIADLQRAVDLLPWYSEGMITSPERFSKNSAYGILARVALYAAGHSLRWDLNTYDAASVKIAQRDDASRVKELYKIAADACAAVINKGENTLLASYEQVFRNLVNGQYNNESMFEIAQYGTNVNGYGIGYTNGMYTHTSSMYGKAQPAMAAFPTYYFDFEEGDARRDVTLCNYGIASDNSRQMNPYSANTIGKFRVTWKSEQGTAINKRDISWPMLRYSDVLLMYAEALNEYHQAPTAEAKVAFEQVRTRGFNNDASKIGTTPASYQEFRNAIILERKLELGFEGWRRTDLARWGVLYETLTEAKENINAMIERTGKYENIDLYRAYKKEKALTFADPVVVVPYVGYKEELTDEQIKELQAEGYIVLKMHGNTALNFGNNLAAGEKWIFNIFRGLEKNKVEILPFAQTTIDNNLGLQGQQHPMY